MKVTPASVKIRRWFVAGVAAVMAIAWTVSSLVTPGTADVGGNSEPGKNASVGQATTAGGVQPTNHYNVRKSYSPKEDIQLSVVPGITVAEYKVRLRNASGRAIYQGSGVGKADLTGDNGQNYSAICIDPFGIDPAHKRNNGGSTTDSIENHPRANHVPGMALMAKKMAYLWGADVSARNYDNLYRKTGVAKEGNSDQYTAAAVYGAHIAFWALDGKVDFNNSEVLSRVAGTGGNEWPAPNVDPKARELAKKMWEMAKKVKLPAAIAGAAGAQPGSSVGNAGFDANGNFVVNYELTGPASANGKEATLNITTAGQPGLPEGATLVDNATARDLKNGSKVTLPASVTLTLPAKAANAYKKVQIQATTANNENAAAATRIPIDITGEAGKQVNVTVNGLPNGGKLTLADGTPFTNGSTVSVPSRIYAIVPSGTQGTLNVNLSNPQGNDTKAAVAVMEQTRSVDTNGDMYVRIGVSGYSDSGKATMSVSNLPAGVTLVDQNGTAVANGSKVDLPSTLTLKVPAGQQAGSVNIGAATSASTGSVLGTVLKPSYPRAQWLTIINGPSGGSSNANAQIGVRWSERPNRPQKGNFTLTKAVTAPDGAGDADKDFTFNVTCTDDEGADVPVDPVVLKKGQSKTVGDFPVGTKCVVNEDEATAAYADGSLVWTGVAYTGGQGAKKNEITIKAGPNSTGTITATNTYDKPAPKEGVFTVRKVVTGVNETVNNNYTFNVTCNAGDAIAPFTLANGESKQIGPLPVNTRCTVEENTTKGTAITGLKYTGVTYTGGQGAKNNEVIVKPTSSDQVTITATNNYTKPKQGSFKIYKDYNEGSDYKDPDKKYKFNVTCDENGTEKTETLYASKNKPAISKLYAVGTSCTVTEDLTYADNVPGMEFVASRFTKSPEVTVSGNSPNQRATFTIKEGEAAMHLTVCNEFKRLKGSFTVEKKIAEGGPSAVNNNFSFTALCDDPATDKELDSEITKTVRAGEKVTFGPYPHGTICKVKENTDSATVPGYTLTAVTYTGGNVSDASTDDAGTDSPSNKGVKVKIDTGSTTAVAVVATNAYERKNGTIKIKKVVTGGPATVTNTYTFNAACKDGEKTLAPITIQLTDGQTKPIGTFPVGTECTVSESDTGTEIENYAYKGVEITGGNVQGKPDTVRVEEGTQEFLVTGTNKYEKETGRFKIVKEFATGSSFTGDDKKAYEFDVNCDQDPVEGSAPTNVTVNKASQWSWTSDKYAVGTSCTVSEKNTAGVKGHSFKGVRITANAGSVKDKVATITIAKGDTPAVTVTATNDYAQPTLQTNASVQGKNKLTKGTETQLVDKLTFANLEKGKTYTAGGYFIDKATKKAVTGFYTRTFTTADLKGVTEANGLVSGYLELTDAAWKVTPTSHGQAFVAFEYLWEGDVPTPEVPTNPGTDKVTPKPDVEHENPDDPNQTVSSEEKGSFTIEKKLAGNAADKVAKDAVFPFTVNCGAERVENVTVGKKFVSEDLPVGTECSVTENDPIAHFEGATFKNVAYTLDGTPVNGKTVTFTIKKGDTPKIAVVATNTYDTPTVTTDAEPEAPALEAEDVTVVDKVSYTNLIAGKEYTVQGQLHYQNGDTPSATDGGVVKGVTPGKGCTVDGKAVEGKDCQAGQQPNSVSYTFVAPGTEGELVSGYVDLVFSVPAEAVQSKPMVVFEDVYYDGKKVAGHHDINDNKQTVPVKEIVEFPIKKLLAGDGKSTADGTYTFTATCSGAKPGEKAEPQTLTATVVNGQPAVSAEKVQAHVGDTCTITEVAPAANDKTTSSVKFDAKGIEGATGGEKLTVKVTKANKDALEAAEFAFEATNTVTVNTGTFSVQKTDATKTGEVNIENKEFTFEYKCADDAEWTKLPAVKAGQTQSGPVKPVGTACEIREADARIANADLATSWTVNSQPVTANGNGVVSFNIGAKDSVVAIGATNAYTEKTGKFTLKKALTTGVTTQELQDTNFTLKYSCSLDGKVRASGQQEVRANAAPVEINGIPVGATCEVQEINLPATPNATLIQSWDVDGVNKDGVDKAGVNTVSFTVASQTKAVAVVANNTYVDKKPGFNVFKKVVGDAAGIDQNAEYTFDYDCTDAVSKKPVTGEFMLTDKQNFSSASDPNLKDLAVGSQCTITERTPANPEHGSWAGVHFDRKGNTEGTWTTDTTNHSVTFTVPKGETAVVVEATNTFNQELGKLILNKQVAGDAAKSAGTSFQFSVSCNYNGKAVDMDNTYTVKPGEKVEIDEIPVDSQCSVSESKVDTTTEITHSLSWLVDGKPQDSADQVTVTIGTGTASTVSVTATNTYQNKPAGFTVKKTKAVVEGEAAGKEQITVPSEFNFEYKCGTQSTWKQLGPITAGGEAASANGIPANSTCYLKELSDGTGNARVVSWKVNGQVASAKDGVVNFTPGPNATVAIEVENTYPYGPRIGTTLTDAAGNHDVSETGKDITLVDTVNYYNLEVGKTYEVTGELMGFDENGSVIKTGITGSTQVTPTKKNGSVKVEFTVPAGKLSELKKVVAFEQLKIDGEVKAKHEEPEDPNQTVKVNPSIATTLTGEDKKAKAYDRPVDPNTVVKLVDTVKYTNLKVGKTYRIAGELYGDNGLTGVKAVSEPFTVTAPEGAKGNDVEFASGTVEMVFEVPGSVLQGNEKLVAFEQLWDEGKLNPPSDGDKTVTPKNPNDTPDAKHEDPKDPDQTMRQNPSIGTYARVKDNDGKDAQVKTIRLTGEAGQTETVIDRISWYNLPEGDYVALGYFMDAASSTQLGEEGTFDGHKAFSVTKSQKAGTVKVPLKLVLEGSNDITTTMNVVVFEEVYKASDVENGVPKEGAEPISEHKDLKDENQNIKVTLEPPLPPEDHLSFTKTVDQSGLTNKLPEDTLYGFEFVCKDAPDNVTRFALKAGEKAGSDVLPTDYMGKECTITEVGPVQAQYSDADGWKPLEHEGMKWSAIKWTKNGEPAGKAIEGEPMKDGKPANTSLDIVIPVEGNGADQDYAFEAANIFTDKPGNPGITTNATNTETGDNMLARAKTAQISDLVEYTDLKPGQQYTVKGELHKKVDGKDGGVITEAKAAKGCLVEGNAIAGTDCKDEGNGVVSLTFTTPAAPEGKSLVSGTVELRFTVPWDAIKAHKHVVAFETAYQENVEIAKHHDIDDDKQTVEIPPSEPPAPGITTDAKDAADGDKSVNPDVDAVIADVVTYTNLKPETKYTVKGDLHKKETDGVDGGVITEAKAGTGCLVDGEAVDGVECKDEGNGVVSLTFTTPAAPEGEELVSGTVELRFNVPQSALPQKHSVVVFETAYDEDGEVARHHDIDDNNQTVEVPPATPPDTPGEPGITTDAKDASDGDKEVSAAGDATIADLVTYKNLKPETEYTVTGDLHKKNADGKDGGVITAAKAARGCLVDGKAVDGVDCKDEGKGKVSLTFTTPAAPEGAEVVNGTVELHFLVPQSELQKTEHIVAFETAYENGGEIAKHHDINDDKQTVKVTPEPKTPTLATSAEDKKHNGGTPDRVITVGSDGYIEDTVSYTALKAGETYTIKGELHKKVDGKDAGIVKEVSNDDCYVVDAEGNAHKAECSAKDGVVSLTFTAPGEAGSYVDGKVKVGFMIPKELVTQHSQFVVFETAYVGSTPGEGDEPIAEHRDINDSDQTVVAKYECPPMPPKGSNPPNPPESPDLPDLPDRPTPPENPNNPDNPDNCPKIGTTLVNLNDKGSEVEFVRGKDHVVTDTVYYEDLLPNTTYSVIGRLHKGKDRSLNDVVQGVTPGKVCTVDGKKTTCQDYKDGFVKVTFTTTGDQKKLNKRGYADGYVTMQFNVPKAEIAKAKKVVAFETLFDEGEHLIAWHHDLNSEPQTLVVTEPKNPGKPSVTPPPSGGTVTPPNNPVTTFLAKTGATTFTLILLGLMALVCGGLLVWASPARRRMNE